MKIIFLSRHLVLPFLCWWINAHSVLCFRIGTSGSTSSVSSIYASVLCCVNFYGSIFWKVHSSVFPFSRFQLAANDLRSRSSHTMDASTSRSHVPSTTVGGGTFFRYSPASEPSRWPKSIPPPALSFPMPLAFPTNSIWHSADSQTGPASATTRGHHFCCCTASLQPFLPLLLSIKKKRKEKLHSNACLCLEIIIKEKLHKPLLMFLTQTLTFLVI